MTQPVCKPIQPGIRIIQGNRLEDLRDLLANHLKAYPLEPLEQETILVQSNGMKHWLEIALAADSALGICAATRMVLPAQFMWEVYRNVLGKDRVPHSTPFDKSNLIWRLYGLLPELAEKRQVYEPLKRYLANAPDGSKDRMLYQLSMQVADVFDAYQSYRADWLSDWAQGKDVLRHSKIKVEGLDAANLWQASLWRDLRDDLDAELQGTSRAGIHRQCMDALNSIIQSGAGQSSLPLPQRVVVFGISSLSAQAIEFLFTLGQISEVLLLVQNPCREFWEDVDKKQGRTEQPLLASWGNQGRDYFKLLNDSSSLPDFFQQAIHEVNHFHDPAEGTKHPTQLNELQSSILNLRDVCESKIELDARDDSIIFKTAHSVQREVEVLHDQLLQWFDDDITLNARDVMVMVPDMESFAPGIQSVFGRFSPGHARHIPFSIADITPRQTPIVQALIQLLELPVSHIGLNECLGLLEVDAVLNRLELDAGDAARIAQWLADSGVRWGLDLAHLEKWGIPSGVENAGQNTWQAGIRRLMLGYAYGNIQHHENDLWCGTLGFPAIRGLDSTTASGMLHWIDAIETSVQELSKDQTARQWVQTMQALIGRFFRPVDDAQERLLAQILEPLDDWLSCCEEAALDTEISLQVVSDHWLSQLGNLGLKRNFFGSGVQFATLMPMRAIPFRRICLLGMNDGAYPRPTTPLDFDLMHGRYRPGDRSRREDDRYLFLEAVLSAREKLYISWQGRRVTDNSEQPPSVLVAQLLEYLNSGWTPGREAQLQPLQAFSLKYFDQQSPYATYDADWELMHSAAGAEGAAEDADEGANDRDVSNAKSDSTEAVPKEISLHELQRLVRHPQEVYFRSRLGIHLDDLDEEAEDEEPFALSVLDEYKIGAGFFQSGNTHQSLARLRASGALPIAGFGELWTDELLRKVDQVQMQSRAWKLKFPHEADPIPVDLQLEGTRIVGTLSGLLSDRQSAQEQLKPGSELLLLMQRTGAVREESGKAPRAHMFVKQWITQLVGCALDFKVSLVIQGVDGSVEIPPVTNARAVETLDKLVDVYKAAWRSPLPLSCKAGFACLLAEEGKQLDAARKKFDSGFGSSGEIHESAYLARSFEKFEDLQDQIGHWAEKVYGDLIWQMRSGKVDKDQK